MVDLVLLFFLQKLKFQEIKLGHFNEMAMMKTVKSKFRRMIPRPFLGLVQKRSLFLNNEGVGLEHVPISTTGR